jgi:uncharacterized repeat protein (TIGR01451 family)
MTMHRWRAGITSLFSSQLRQRRSKHRHSAETAELLETKVLLAADTLGLIRGTVFNDVAGDGLPGGDPGINVATVQLYRDGGNLTFDNGGVDDTLIDSMTTGSSGTYSFEGLTAGRYYVRQLSVAGYMQRAGENVVTVTISPTDALGTPGKVIDDFISPAGTGQALLANAAGAATVNSFASTTTAIGVERDMVVTATLGSVQFEANGTAFPGNLNYNANFGATGSARVVWDGADNNATSLSPSGLGAQNLRSLGDTGFEFAVGTSQPVTLSMIVHSGPANSSTSTFNLPISSGDTLYVPYSSFVITTGTGADFSNVGAIELLIDAPVATTTTVIDVVRTQVSTPFTANFANVIPMTLGNLIFGDTNNNGLFDSGTESGIDGVDLTLFEDTNGNNTFDSGTDLQIATTTTAGGGLYDFTNLFPGNYIVRVDSSNFLTGNALQKRVSSTGNGVAPDEDTTPLNNDDNGDLLGDAVVSLGVTLSNGLEPITDGDTDPNTNLNLDFGFAPIVDIVVTKSDNVDPVIAGSGVGNLVYTVTALNSGLATATGLTINDTGVIPANLPAGVSFVSATGSGGSTFNSTTGLWTIGTLAPNTSQTLVVTLTVDATASDILVISNTASLSTVNEIEVDAVPGNDTATETTDIDRSVDIVVEKVANSTTIVAGSSPGNLVYTITARNAGPSNASGLNLLDPGVLPANLPAGVTFLSANGTGGSSFNTTSGVWTIGNLAAGVTETLTVTLTVGASAAQGLVISNTASLSTLNENDTNLTNNSQSTSTSVTREVDIQVTKLGLPTTVIAGSGAGNLVYTVTAMNVGVSDSSGVRVSDTDIQTANLPAGVSFVSAVGSGGTSYNPATGIWTVGSLTPGASQTLTVTLTVGASASDTLVISNTAALSAVNETDTEPDNNSQTITTDVDRRVDIAVTKTTTNSPVIAGSGTGNLEFTVMARNNGPSNASGVTINDPNILAANLPAGVSFVSATGSGTIYNPATGIWTVGSLATGASVTLTVTLTVGASASDSLLISNTATLATVNETDTDSTNNSQTVTVNVDRSVDIVVTKLGNPNTVVANSGTGNLVYTVTARNAGPSNASGVSLLDTGVLAANLPAGVTFVSAVGSNGSTFNSTTGIWTIGNLANTVTETLTVTLTVGAAANGQIINNTASLSTLNETDSDQTNNSQSTVTNVIREVDIQVTKSAAPATVIAGSGFGNLVYVVTARNVGVLDSTGVTISDSDIQTANLPAGVSFVSAAGSGGSTYNPATGIWTVGNLAVGASVTLTVTLTVGASASDSLVISNTATLATVNETDIVSTNNSQTVTTNVDRSVDIVVRKLANANSIVAGSGAGNLIYTVTARNVGPSNASGLALLDSGVLAANLPPGVTFVSAVGSSGSTFNSTSGVWTIGNLSAGITETLTVTLTVGASAAHGLVINNTASLSTLNENETDLTNNSESTITNTTREVDIQVTKTAAPPSVIAGSGVGNLVYTVTARNVGASDSSGVTISDTDIQAANLPAGVSFVSAVGSGGTSYNPVTGIWTVGNLAPGISQTLTVTLTVGASASDTLVISNTATLAAVNETDTVSANNSQNVTTNVDRRVDIAVTKTATNSPVIAGSGVGNLVYIITARNNGPSNASGVTINDPNILAANLPAGVNFVSASGSGTIYNPATGIWTIGNLASGASVTLTVTLTVGASASDSLVISNTATLGTVNETDTVSANNSQTVTTNVDRRVDIVVTKTANASSVTAGNGDGNLVYTVTASNAGASDATNVTVSDLGVLAANLPANVSFASAAGSSGSTFNSTTGIWNIGSLAAGASRTLSITLTVSAAAADGLIISNTALVASVNETETNLLNNRQTVTTAVIGGIDLLVVKTGTPNPVLSPGQLTYTVRVTNNGKGTATGVVLTDNLGPGVTYSSGTSTQGSVSHLNGIVTATIGTMNSGASVTLTLVTNVNVALAGTLVNTASATSDQTDVRPNDNISSIQTQAQLAPASLNGVVFQDLNQNGSRESNERLLSGVQIVLFGTDVYGIMINRRVATSSNGTYSFTNLVPGRYTAYQIQPDFFNDGADYLGVGATGTLANDAFQNLALNAGVNATAFNFTEGTEDLSKRPFLSSSQNAGQTQVVSLPVTGVGSLSGIVATDSNRNGILDSGDVGIPSVVVSLAGNDTAGNPVLIHQSTDSLGRYSFANLPGGQYSILETQPKGKIDGPEQAGTILPDMVLDDVFSAISLPGGGVGTGYNFLELPTTAGTTTATFATLLTPTSSNVGLRPTISWTPISSAARYDLWVSQIAGNKGLVYRNENVSGTSITIPGDLALGAHRVWVRSINSAGSAGPWSQPLSFNVAIQANALAVLGVSLNSKPTLDWADIPNATSYDMRLVNVANGVVLANVSNLPTSQYSGLSTLPPGKYRYFVRGNTVTTQGQWSDGYDHTILSIPTLETATATTTAKPTLHWNAVPGAATYEVWLTDLSKSGGATRISGVEKTNATSMPVPANLELGNYRYWVRAFDSQGKQTSWSSPANLKVETAGKITSPTGTISNTTPTITWKSVPGAQRYDVWVVDKAGNLYVRDQNVTGTSYTPSKQFVNGDYRVWVKPIGPTTSGTWSPVSAFTVSTIVRPTLTSPSATTGSTPAFAWTNSPGAVRYELWVDKVGGASKVLHKTNVAGAAFTATTPLQSGLYRVWVRAFDITGTGSLWSSALDFRVL